MTTATQRINKETAMTEAQFNERYNKHLSFYYGNRAELIDGLEESIKKFSAAPVVTPKIKARVDLYASMCQRARQEMSEEGA